MDASRNTLWVEASPEAPFYLEQSGNANSFPRLGRMSRRVGVRTIQPSRPPSTSPRGRGQFDRYNPFNYHGCHPIGGTFLAIMCRTDEICRVEKVAFV